MLQHTYLASDNTDRSLPTTSGPEMQYLLVHSVVVTATHNRGAREDFVDFGELNLRERNVASSDVLQVALLVPGNYKLVNTVQNLTLDRNLRRTRDGDNVWPAGDDPGDGELSGSDTLLLSDPFSRVDESHVMVECLLLEAGEAVAHVASCDTVNFQSSARLLRRCSP